jgi:urease accessory protein
MHAATHLVVGVDPDDHGHGRSRLLRAWCEVPLVFRQAATDDPELVLTWVAGAAGPIGDDELRLSVEVQPGTRLRVRSSGAQLVQPGPLGGASRLDVTIELGAGASLDWWPEPTVSVRGSVHRTSMRIHAHPTASARIVETVRRGRHGEPSGRITLHQRVVVGATPVLDQTVELGDGPLSGPGAHGARRTTLSAITLGAMAVGTPRTIVSPDLVAAAFELGHGAVLVSATADDLRTIAAADLLGAGRVDADLVAADPTAADVEMV